MVHYGRQAELKISVMGWVIGFSIVAVLIIGFLLLPVEVVADSEREEYRAGIMRLVYIQLLPDGSGWKWGFRAGWWKKDYQLGLPPGRKAGKARKPGRKKAGGMRPAAAWKKGRRLLASFRVRRFRVNLDTDDFILNAYLYPIFTLLNGRNRRLAINFQGQTMVDVFMTNRVWKVLWALMR